MLCFALQCINYGEWNDANIESIIHSFILYFLYKEIMTNTTINSIQIHRQIKIIYMQIMLI